MFAKSKAEKKSNKKCLKITTEFAKSHKSKAVLASLLLKTVCRYTAHIMPPSAGKSHPAQHPPSFWFA